MKKFIAIIAAAAAIIALTVTVTVNACFTHCNVYSESPVTIEFYGHTWEHNAQED